MNAVRTGRRRGRRKTVVLLALLVVAALLLGLVLLLWYLLAGRLPKPPGPLPGPFPTKPESQPASCPDVQLVAVPGTWESTPTDDPHNPSAVPIALLQNVTRPLQDRFPPDRVDVFTIPYVAQFSNPVAIPPDGQQSYNNSRGAGTQVTTDVLTGMHQNCPLTNFVIVGFSQGAVIAGDIAAQIGADKGPVPEDQVLGVMLIADGRRDGGAIEVGASAPGIGAEVALKGLKVPGITMTGPRPGGFGELADRVYDICAPGDLICAAPQAALNPLNIPGSFAALLGSAGNPVHAQYNGFVVDGSGATATQWTTNWAAQLIESAPRHAHE